MAFSPTLWDSEYEPLKSGDIKIPYSSVEDIPQFNPSDVWLKLTRLKTNKSTVQGDSPYKNIQMFAAYLADPLTDIINTSLRRGEYPDIYISESVTPVPKTYPCQRIDQLRNISQLFCFDKIMESLIAELMVSDMKPFMDASQYGNQKNVSIQHYLINMIHRILSAVDKNTVKETFAVIATYIDWSSAFPRQCPKLGVQSFIDNGVRPSLIPVLINYFQGTQMTVKHHGCTSKGRQMNGGGPQGATFGILEIY